VDTYYVPITVSKETYYSVKRDLSQSQTWTHTTYPK